MSNVKTSRKSIFVLVSTALIISGCAQKSADVGSSYVSPLQYQSYSCSQISSEAQRISSRAAQVSGVQNKNASNDAVATGVAIVLFWPAVFFIGGNKQNSAELARLKGELEAIEQASIQKKCGIKFRRAVPDEAVKA